MAKENRKVMLIFVISLALVFQMAAAHSYYDSLIEADFLGNGLKFEAADLDTFLVDKQTNLDLSTGAAAAPFVPETGIFDPLTPKVFPVPSSGKSNSILRC
jgi:hypothetical protein